MVWWVSEQAIKRWLPEARRSLAALVEQGYVEEQTGTGGRTFYRLTPMHGGQGKASRKQSRYSGNDSR
jgi:hypothetical protein